MDDVVGFRAEGQCPHTGVDAIGAHHDVEGADEAAAERDLDAVGAVRERLDAIAEDGLGVIGDEVMEDLGEIALHDLDLGHGAAIADEEVGGHRGELSAGAVDVAQTLLVHDALAHPRHDAHPLCDDLAQTAKVDSLPAETEI